MSSSNLQRSQRQTTRQNAIGRGSDVLFSAAALGVLLPLFVALAIAIKLSDRGPVFYRQLRVGRRFRPFYIHKFRTMVPGADRLGAGITAAGDPRVTVLGRYLRRHKLDELPQLWDVLRGEMSLVGPRPEIPEFVERFHAMYEGLLSVRPGITDPAALVFSNEEELLCGAHFQKTYEEQVLPKKLSLSLAYLRDRTWRSDLTMIVRTFTKCLEPEVLGRNHRASPRCRETSRRAG